MAFRTKQDHVSEILRERIISGFYKRGQKLKQSDIANELGVSVTPVREALRNLEAEGYVLGLSHRGVLVPHFIIEQAEELYELRLTLERDLTVHAFPAVTRQALAELKERHRDCLRAYHAEERLELRAANYRFHFRFYELANRPQTLQFVRVLWAKYPFHLLDAIDLRVTRVIGEHEEFLATLESGDVDGAAAAMVKHIKRGWEEFSRAHPRTHADGAAAAEATPQIATKTGL